MRRLKSGVLEELPGYYRIVLRDGESIVSVSCGGSGYGPPEEREAVSVAKDLSEGWITTARAPEMPARSRRILYRKIAA
jgi:N-methylhydantoinase B